jgi:hypothetical protein
MCPVRQAADGVEFMQPCRAASTAECVQPKKISIKAKKIVMFCAKAHCKVAQL